MKGLSVLQSMTFTSFGACGLDTTPARVRVGCNSGSSHLGLCRLCPQTNTQSIQHLVDSVKARLCTFGKRLIQAFTPHTCGLSHLRHPTGTGHVIERLQKRVHIAVSQHLSQVTGNILIGFEVTRSVKTTNTVFLKSGL